MLRVSEANLRKKMGCLVHFLFSLPLIVLFSCILLMKYCLVLLYTSDEYYTHSCLSFAGVKEPIVGQNKASRH